MRIIIRLNEFLDVVFRWNSCGMFGTRWITNIWLIGLLYANQIEVLCGEETCIEVGCVETQICEFLVGMILLDLINMIQNMIKLLSERGEDLLWVPIRQKSNHLDETTESTLSDSQSLFTLEIFQYLKCSSTQQLRELWSWFKQWQ